jgi:L(+)-tartrate dehydratase beta subunit
MVINEVYLDMPLDDDAIAKLRLGDIVYLSGVLYTSREGSYAMLFDKGLPPPVDIAALSNVSFNCSPAVREEKDGSYTIPSVTATASFRFAKYMPEFMRRFKVKALIGKTGMPPMTYENVFRRYGAVYLNTVGYGLGAIYGSRIKKVQQVVWKEELGLAQAIWFLEVENFGPLIVECDSRGNSMFEKENALIDKTFLPLYDKLEGPVLKRLGEAMDPCTEML